ncbi:hypothetical protein NB640_06900 [Oxalobacter vibrioformis]|uniref:Uncharacterized protein n=1 Tax=Oxalobacter vibrioformis TaxID=933080 RepID=A0A9E9LUL7_9BURK|nr:hypothetical protein [Oxalobacter vibrioformis]WAW09017.1 hypothetical protein NB640_06900 [Oxalobacter vibrioformis]
MLQYLINVTSTILPALLLAGLLSGLIKKQNAWPLRRYLAGGILFGSIIAMILAVLRLSTGFVIRELYNAPLLLLMIVAEAVLLLWLFALRKNMDFYTGRRAAILVFVLGFVWSAFALPDMVLYPFEFDVGMDSIYNQAFLNKVAGYLIALVVASLAALSLFRLSVRYGKKLFARIFFLATAISALWHTLLFLQIAVLRRWVPDFSWLVELVMYSLAYQNAFLFALLGLAVYAAASSIRTSRRSVIDGPNPALQRKQKN